MLKNERLWLTKMTSLNKARNNAPHKPLLLLVILEMAERGLLSEQDQCLTPEMAFIFDGYATVVVHRRTKRPDIRMPFHHLSTQKFWNALTESNTPSTHRSLTKRIRFDPTFLACCNNAEFRISARKILISTHFEPAERNALYHLSGMQIPREDIVAETAEFYAEGDAAQTGRSGRFRLDVAAAYRYECALTGYSVTTALGRSIVDAAHIHPFSNSRNNDPRNGIALCKNAHWLFDCGLWSVDDKYYVIVASEAFVENTCHQPSLRTFHGTRLRLPVNESLWPDQRNLEWHRKHCFVG